HRRRDHRELAPAGWQHEHGEKNGGEEKEIVQSAKRPRLVRRLGVAYFTRCAEKVDAIEGKKHGGESEYGDEPALPAVFEHPPEWDAFQIAHVERRVADGREAAACIAHDEDEKDDVERGDAILVHANPRADEQHRGTGGSDDVCKHSAD